MAEIKVWEVASRSDRREFIQLPFREYAHDPNWVPPLLMTQEELLGFRKHPFHEYSKVTNFLASRDGKIVGRISAIVNNRHNERFNEKRGFFGFFESIHDRAVAHALFDKACACLKSQGMTDVRGPCNPSLNYDLGTLIEGFDTPPTFMMTYNPPYHDELISSYGFAKVRICMPTKAMYRCWPISIPSWLLSFQKSNAALMSTFASLIRVALLTRSSCSLTSTTARS